MKRTPPDCSPVAAYLWIAGDQTILEVPALAYWPDYTGQHVTTRKDGSDETVQVTNGHFKSEGKGYVLLNFTDCDHSEPTHERLENGWVQPIKMWFGRQTYCRSRRMPPNFVAEPVEQSQ